MTNVGPNALSLAVAIAISSSVIGTEALADRRLQIKSVDIQGNKHVEFIQSEVMVKPTLDHDQQPIAKSFTTTYPDQTQVRAGYDVPSEGFTDVLSDIQGGVSTVDQFETDDNDVAQKYTKILKVGNEGIFRFTHNLEDSKLVIEVRDGMTRQDSIEAVRTQPGGIRPLEPLTKVASPEQLAGVLKGAHERAGNLGEADHYVTLAALTVGEIEVNGRTFMRLIAAGDQPPEPERLGESLFVNDEALFAAATSAYTQVYLLGEDLQQRALDKLFYYNQPLGYVVTVEDDTQAYPVPWGYPKLELTEATGKVIVFRGQKQNPTDLTFVESLYAPLDGFDLNDNDHIAQFKKGKVKSYQYVIRSRQMELLEKFAADLAIQHDAELEEDKMVLLAYYESVQQALTIATSYGTDEFELKVGHVGAASSAIAPGWMLFQLEKRFSFKPAFKDLLTSRHFLHNVQKGTDFVNKLMQQFAIGEDTTFVKKVMGNMARQHLELENTPEERRAKEAQLAELDTLKEQLAKTAELNEQNKKSLHAMSEAVERRAIAIEHNEIKLRVEELEQRLEDNIELHCTKLKDLKNQNQMLQQEVDRIPYLKQEVLDVAAKTIRARNTELAIELGMADWDDTQPPEEQTRLIKNKIHENNQAKAATFTASGQPDKETVKAKLAAIESELSITPVDENNLDARFQSIQQHMQHQATLANERTRRRLATIEGQLGLSPDNDADLEARHWAIQQRIRQQGSEVFQHLQQQSTRTDTAKAAEIKTRFATIAARLDIQDFDSDADIETQQECLLEKIKTMNVQPERLHHSTQTIIKQQDSENSYTRPEKSALAAPPGQDQSELNEVITTEELNALRSTMHSTLLRNAALEEQLKDIITPGQSRATPEVLETLRAAERILQQSHINEREDIYYNRQIISEDIRRYITEARQREESGAWIILQLLEDKLGIGHRVSESDSTEAKLARVRTKLDGGDVSNDQLADIDQLLRMATDRPDLEGDPVPVDALLSDIRDCLNLLINESDQRARKRQANQLIALEDALNISPQHRDKEVFKAGQPEVNERIAAIENELDRQMARLGPKPRFVLDRDVALAKREIKGAENDLAAFHHKLNKLRGKNLVFAGNLADLQHIPDTENLALNQRMKEVQIELGLAASDEQTTKERLKDIRHFLQECSAEKRDEILGELRIKSGLDIQTTGDPGLEEASDYLIATASCADSHGRNEDDEALGQLLYNRKRYTQLTDFLREHDRKSMKVADAKNAQEYLERKKCEVIDPGDFDEQAKAERENEMAWLNLALEQSSDAVSKAETALTDFHKAVLETTEKDVGLEPAPADTLEQRLNALRNRKVEYGGNDGYGGTVRHLIQEQADLQGKIELRKADIERIKGVLKAAEQAVDSDSGPFQYTPKQVKVLDTIRKFTQQHPLKKQALEAAIGLEEAARESGKLTVMLSTFNFDDDFAAIRMQGMVGDKITFAQAGRIVQALKSLKTFPKSTLKPISFRPQSAIEHVESLSSWAIHQKKTGAQQYDDVISDMGKAAIHFVEHEPGDLKSFPEYFASHSASGNKIMTLLREGLISKVELESYIKIIRIVKIVKGGAPGYPAQGELDYYMGRKHGVDMHHFFRAVRMLSDKGAEEFMQSAFIPVTVTATGPAGMRESVAGMKEYATAVIANYVLDDIAFENGRRTAAFLANIQDTLTPYANAAGILESELIKVTHDTLMKAQATAVELQLKDYWVKPSASLVQAVTWYYISYKPLLASTKAWNAVEVSLSDTLSLYILDLTNRGDYMHRMIIPFQHWLEYYGIDLDRTGQYVYHGGVEQVSEMLGLAMPFGRTESSVILLATGVMLFTRQNHANPHMYRSITRLVPEIVKSMGSRQGVQVPLLHRVTPQKIKTLASATAGLVLGPVATFGAYVHSFLFGITYAQIFGFVLASSLTFDFFMNDNKMLTQWLGGPLGRSLDKINRWCGLGETYNEYLQRTAIASPQGFSETDEEYARRVKGNNTMYGWMRHENYLQFRERRDRTMKLFENGWEKYFRENVPKWSFSHAESIPYFYTLGAFFESQKSDDQKFHNHDKRNAPQSGFPPAAMDN
ncbi:hypothetical protein [Endozoicomonas sp. ALC066]|uniref:hypothetical protein n=1 Tax=Endozoicomonas sp. ALC066 TaxID=3403078 RepID=UPI003BB535F8